MSHTEELIHLNQVTVARDRSRCSLIPERGVAFLVWRIFPYTTMLVFGLERSACMVSRARCSSRPLNYRHFIIVTEWSAFLSTHVESGTGKKSHLVKERLPPTSQASSEVSV